MNNNIETFKVPDDGISLAVEYEKTQIEFSAKFTILKEEYNKSAIELGHEYEAKLKRLWYQICNLTGVDADLSWKNRSWDLDTRYAEHGFAAMIHAKEQQPMHQAVSNETVPEGTVLN